MTSPQEMSCWEIMNCKGTETCKAKKNVGEPCWDIAQKNGGSQYFFNICRDCVVFIIKQHEPILSAEEIENIMKSKLLDQESTECPCLEEMNA